MNYTDWLQIQNHYYLGTRNVGPSRALKGRVVIIHVLVNDMMSNWMYPMYVAEYQNACNEMASKLMREAAASGTSLFIQSAFCQVNLPMYVDMNNTNWLPFLFGSMGHANASSMQRQYEAMYGCDEAPIIFALNRPMRSFASLDNERSFMRMDEFSVVFRHQTGFFDSGVITHELLHQFGAVDYYYPQVTVNAANCYFPDSIMFRGGPAIDDLTRYLIGWTDELTPTAIAFLQATSSVDDYMLMQARMRGI